MSRFLAHESLAMYLCQLNSIVSSWLCNHTSMKCLDSSSSFQFFTCAIRLLEELSIAHPCHALVIQTLRTFHEKYHGCSCKTLLFFLTNFYQQIHVESNPRVQKKIFEALEEFIDQSQIIVEELFVEKLLITPEIFSRICRYQTIYSDALYQAYEHFLSSQVDPIEQFDHLNHLTRVKYLEERCVFIPGTILPVDPSIRGRRRTVLIDGYLLEDYVHLGYNNKLRVKQISRTSSWTSLILAIVKEYSIDVILCSGTIDRRLIDACPGFIEKIPSKTLRVLSGGEEDDDACLLNYLTDIHEDNVRLFNYVQSNEDAQLTIIEQGSTIVQYVPLESLVDARHDQFTHCLGRVRHILRAQLYLNGSGEVEERLYQYWYERHDERFSNEKTIAYQCFLECLRVFTRELVHRRDCFESELIDDCQSKFAAWRSSLELLKVLVQIDTVVETVVDENYSDI